jgi:enamine deaminase RidA (YjgF/YER057c/UK114 family)
MSAEARLRELGIVLPEPPEAVAAYVPFVIASGLVFVSGQIPVRGGGLPRTGLVGQNVSLEEAQEEARFCALNLLAQLRVAAGSLDQIERIVRLGVYVASAPGFRSQPAVANGASELMVEVFGDAGRHARAAVGTTELPLGAPVEVEGIAALAS